MGNSHLVPSTDVFGFLLKHALISRVFKSWGQPLTKPTGLTEKAHNWEKHNLERQKDSLAPCKSSYWVFTRWSGASSGLHCPVRAISSVKHNNSVALYAECFHDLSTALTGQWRSRASDGKVSTMGAHSFARRTSASITPESHSIGRSLLHNQSKHTTACSFQLYLNTTLRNYGWKNVASSKQFPPLSHNRTQSGIRQSPLSPRLSRFFFLGMMIILTC